MLGMDERAFRVAWTVFAFALLVAIVYYIRDTLLVFAAAIFFAYILSPIVSLVERFMPRRRAFALAIVYIVLIGSLVGLGFALIPALGAEATSLFTRLPSLLTGGSLATLPLPHWLEPMRAQVISALIKQATNLEAAVVPFIQQTGSRILSGVGYLLPLILVPILAFFFLKDARVIRKAIIGTIGEASDRTTLGLILDDVHEVLRSYMRALVLLSIASFLAWLIFLNMVQYSYALLLSGIAGILEFIPVIGPAVALVTILVVCGVTGAGGLIWVVVFWAAYRIFQDYVLNPYLMSAGVEVHPLLVLFGVLAGERIGGIPGMFFSVPVIAILKVIYMRLRMAPLRPTPREENVRVPV
jgi:predicted PurR-regulated permease PerM